LDSLYCRHNPRDAVLQEYQLHSLCKPQRPDRLHHPQRHLQRGADAWLPRRGRCRSVHRVHRAGPGGVPVCTHDNAHCATQCDAYAQANCEAHALADCCPLRRRSCPLFCPTGTLSLCSVQCFNKETCLTSTYPIHLLLRSLAALTWPRTTPIELSTASLCARALQPA